MTGKLKNWGRIQNMKEEEVGEDFCMKESNNENKNKEKIFKNNENI